MQTKGLTSLHYRTESLSTRQRANVIDWSMLYGVLPLLKKNYFANYYAQEIICIHCISYRVFKAYSNLPATDEFITNSFQFILQYLERLP